MSPRRVFLALAAIVALAAPSAAAGDGLPVPVEDAGPTGILSPDGSARFVTSNAGHGRTIVQKIDPHGGKILDSTTIHGKFTIPVVGLDGTAAGLSHDGSVLVLIKPRTRFPRANTAFAVLDAQRPHLHLENVIRLKGDFSFDAISPDGSRAYLIQYTSPRDPQDYLVRTLNPFQGRLDPKPVVDPNEEPDEMNGLPLTRVTSADGRWHYTLYDGAGTHPFVHALDTQARAAKCIDLPPFPRPEDLYAYRLKLVEGGNSLIVTGLKGAVFARIDTGTFAVSATGAPAKPAGRTEADEPGASFPIAEAIVGAVLLLSGLGLAIAARRRRLVGVHR
jgi:hypothetical protein